ncbi:MAG: VCBS repeat-containing protein, partial [Acidobacteriota bacterium]
MPAALLLGVLLALGAAPALAGEIPFEAALPIAPGFGGAVSVDAGDLDGDGDLDLVSASLVDGEVRWWENAAGDASVWTERTVADGFPQAASVRLVDLEDDGDLDVLAISTSLGTLRYWRNLGAGASWTAFDIATGLTGGAFAIGMDVDSNSSADVVESSSAGLVWWRNRFSTGVFFERNVIDATGAPASSITSADVDGDGDPDLLVSFAGGR